MSGCIDDEQHGDESALRSEIARVERTQQQEECNRAAVSEATRFAQVEYTPPQGTAETCGAATVGNKTPPLETDSELRKLEDDQEEKMRRKNLGSIADPTTFGSSVDRSLPDLSVAAADDDQRDTMVGTSAGGLEPTEPPTSEPFSYDTSVFRLEQKRRELERQKWNEKLRAWNAMLMAER